MSLLDKTKRLYFLAATILLLLLVGISYQQAPNNGYHLDDRTNIVERAAIRVDKLDVQGLLTAGSEGLLPTRALPNISFAIDWWRGNGQPETFQRTNILLHALTTLLVFIFILTLLRRHFGQQQRLIWFACAGAALWALHPIQTQAITYIVQRMASMAALFALLSVFAYIKGRLSVGTRWPWFVLAITAFVCGALSKENAWATPAFILLAEFGVVRHKEALIQCRLDYLWLSLPIIAALCIIIDLVSDAGPLSQYIKAGYIKRHFTLGERLLTQPRVIAFHLSQILWPWYERFSLEHDFITSTRLLSPPSTLFALSGLFAWCSAGLWLLFKQNYRLFGFALLWLPLTLAVESSVIPLEMVFEHRMYLPSVSLAALAALGLTAAWQFNQRAAIITTCIVTSFLVFCIFSTMQRIAQWKNEITLLESALDNAPNSARVRGNLAARYLQNGQQEQARQTLAHALQLDPNEPTALEIHAVILMDDGHLEAAERIFSRLSNVNRSASALNHHGELYLKLKRYDKALQLFRIIIDRAPWVPAYHWNIALTYEKLNDCSSAKHHWEYFLNLNEATAEDKADVREHLDQNYHQSRSFCNHLTVKTTADPAKGRDQVTGFSMTGKVLGMDGIKEKKSYLQYDPAGGQ